MASGVARSRSLFKFLSVDPEIYPLLGVLSATFGVAGFMLGRKAAAPLPESNVKLAEQETFPWHVDNKKANYKYRFHVGNPEEVSEAPTADTSHSVVVSKDVAQKVGEKFGKTT